MQTPTSPSLPELQRWMRWLITDPRGPYRALSDPHALDHRPDGTCAQFENWAGSFRSVEPLPRQFDAIADVRPLAREARVSIYADAYFIRLLESLGADFAAVRRAAGETAFRQLVADYLLRHPSTSPHVGDLGSLLPTFLRTHALAQTHPYLPDLAKLEWNVLRSIYSRRLPPLEVSRLRDIAEDAWPKAKLLLDPTVRLISTEWTVDRLRAQKGSAHRHRRWLIIYRDDVWVEVKSIDGPQWFALERLQENKTLEQVCQDLSDVFQQETEQLPIMEWFGGWIRDGIVKEILL